MCEVCAAAVRRLFRRAATELTAQVDQVKLKRAKGECLGAKSRRRTWKAAKSHGEKQTFVDPWVSEWGNPAGKSPVTVHRINKCTEGNAVN